MSSRNEELRERLAEIHSKIPSDRTLIVVTKTFPVSDAQLLYDLGERNFAENRDSEGQAKSSILPNDAIWHFQGEIQSQKIRSILSWADYIHSLDELRHAEKISAIASEMGKRQKVFVQTSLDPEPGIRGGVDPKNLDALIEAMINLSGLELVGVMGIAPLHGDPARAFARLQALSDQVSHQVPQATAISAGMSDDFEIALRFGATHLRLGSSILGSRHSPL